MTAIVPPDGGGVYFECDPLGINECEPGLSCVPWDAMGIGLWSGAYCVPSPRNPAALGEVCSIPNGPIGGQSGCEAGLVCAAPPDATEGVCIPMCNAFNACDVGRCTACANPNLGVCLDAVPCDGETCVATGCL